MQLRRRDVEQWMSHRRLPEDLRRFLHITSKPNIVICMFFDLVPQTVALCCCFFFASEAILYFGHIGILFLCLPCHKFFFFSNAAMH